MGKILEDIIEDLHEFEAELNYYLDCKCTPIKIKTQFFEILNNLELALRELNERENR